MLAKLSLGPEALLELGAGQPPKRAKVEHQQLIRQIHAHGLLALDNSQAESLVNLLRTKPGQLPAGRAREWLELLTAFIKDRRRFERLPDGLWDETRQQSSVSAFQDAVRAYLDIAVVGVAEAERLRLGYDDDESVPEITRADWASTCDTFRRFADIADAGHLPMGASRDNFWRDILRPLAQASRSVVVIDPYLYSGLRNHRPRATPEHVCWLLENLDGALQGGTVTFIGPEPDDDRRPGPQTAQETLDLILRNWQRSDSRVRELEVVLVPRRRWEGQRSVKGDLPHDRHIRFSAGPATILNSGFDRLRSRLVTDKDGMNWSYRWLPDALEPLRAAEERCLQSAEVDRAVWKVD